MGSDVCDSSRLDSQQTAWTEHVFLGARAIGGIIHLNDGSKMPSATDGFPVAAIRSSIDQTQEEAMRNFSFATAAVTLVLALASSAGAPAAEIVVLAAAAVEVPFEAVVHAFEHDTGNKVAATFGSVGAIQSKLKAGVNADLVILSTALV